MTELEIVEKCVKLGISFNDYLLLYLISNNKEEQLREYISINGMFDPNSIDKLVELNLLINENEDGRYLLSKLKPVKKVSDNIDNWINDWYDLFPKRIKSGGYYVRSDIKGCKTKLKRFMLRYPEFSKDTILKATKKYVDDMENNNYKFMKIAPYFIEKNGISMLYGYCESLTTDSEIEEDWTKVKV